MSCHPAGSCELEKCGLLWDQRDEFTVLAMVINRKRRASCGFNVLECSTLSTNVLQ